MTANLHAALYATAGECAAGNGNDTILLPAGTFRLMIPGAGEDRNATSSPAATGSSPHQAPAG